MIATGTVISGAGIKFPIAWVDLKKVKWSQTNLIPQGQQGQQGRNENRADRPCANVLAKRQRQFRHGYISSLLL